MMDDTELRTRVRNVAEPMPAETRTSVRASIESALAGASQVAVMGRGPSRRRRLIAGAASAIAIAAAIVAIVVWAPDNEAQHLVVSTTPEETTVPTTAPASSVPSTAPPATTVAAAPGTVGLPGGFTVSSMSWPSVDDGWIVGWPRGAVGPPSLLHTADGGASWNEVATPVDPVQEWHVVVFADSINGWLLGDHVYSTHDGGNAWTEVPLGETSPPAAAVAANGTVHVAFATDSGLRLASSPTGDDAFVTSALTIPFGGGPVLDVRITAGGSYAALIYNDRTFIAGAEIRDGEWTAWSPCNWPDGNYVADAALAPDGSLLSVACGTSQFGSPPGTIVALDHADNSFHPLPGADGSTPDRIPMLSFVEVTAQRTMLAVYDEKLAVSTDAGHTWTVTHTFAEPDYPGAHGDIPDLGYVIVTGPGAGILSRDGGLTWEQLP